MRREPVSALALLVQQSVVDAVAAEPGLAAGSGTEAAQAAAEVVGSATRPLVLVLDRDAGTIASRAV
jgi:hypothetical protein